MARKLTQEEFTKKAIENNEPNSLDLSESVYINVRTKTKVRCILHNETFFQKPPQIMKGAKGCSKCCYDKLSAGNRKEDGFYISEIDRLYGGKYTVVKIQTHENITLRCPFHGEFERSFTSLKRSFGCYDCTISTKRSGLKKDTSSFIKLAKSVHGNRYTYNNVNYTDSKQSIEIKCNTCEDVFLQKPNTHLSGKGCMKCWRNRNRQPKPNTRIPLEEIEKRARMFFGDTLDFSESELVTSNEKVKVFCKICQEYFEQWRGHLTKGVGCQRCSKRIKESKPEKLICKLLLNKSIKFKREKTFNGCVYVNKLRFDFFIPELNTCIEYQGEQHYKPVSIFGGEESFRIQIIKDSIKKKFCHRNNINLILIKYDEDIESVINRMLQH